MKNDIVGFFASGFKHILTAPSHRRRSIFNIGDKVRLVNKLESLQYSGDRPIYVIGIHSFMKSTCPFIFCKWIDRKGNDIVIRTIYIPESWLLPFDQKLRPTIVKQYG